MCQTCCRSSRRRCLFATHYHSLCQDPSLASLVRMGHMRAAVDARQGLLPSYRLAPGAHAGTRVALQRGLALLAASSCACKLVERHQGRPSVTHPSDAGPAPNGSCGIAVAAACQLPPGVIACAAAVAQQAERTGQPIGGGPSAGNGVGPSGRAPLHALNRQAGIQQQQPEPAAKRQRTDAAASNEHLEGEQREALAAVRAALAAALAGEPGSAAQLVALQAAVREALAAGEL